MAGATLADLVPPILQFRSGHVLVTRDVTALTRWSRAGLRRRWHVGLLLVDATGLRYPVTAVTTRSAGFRGWLHGELDATLTLGPPAPVAIDDLRRSVADTLRVHHDHWDADGQLEQRLAAVHRAEDVASLADALDTPVP